MTWKMRVMTDLIVGHDGISRSAIARTRSGPLTQSITKFYPLDLTASGDPKEDFHSPINTRDPTILNVLHPLKLYKI